MIAEIAGSLSCERGPKAVLDWMTSAQRAHPAYVTHQRADRSPKTLQGAGVGSGLSPTAGRKIPVAMPTFRY